MALDVRRIFDQIQHMAVERHSLTHLVDKSILNIYHETLSTNCLTKTNMIFNSMKQKSTMSIVL